MNERGNYRAGWLMTQKKRYVKNAYLIVFSIVFFCGVVTSLALYHEEKQHLMLDENIATEQFITRLKDALAQYGREVAGVAIMVQSMDEPLTNPIFQRASRQLESTEKNNTLRVYFAKYVPHSQRDTYVTQQQGLAGLSAFQITPSEIRKEYLPLTYGYPFFTNPGFDLLSDTYSNRDVIQQIRSYQGFEMSELPTFSSEGVKQKTRSFALRRSIYIPLDNIKNRVTDEFGFYGIVGIIFEVNGLVRQLNVPGIRGVAYRIADITEGSQTPVWFADSRTDININAEHISHWEKGHFNTTNIYYGGRNWRVDTRNSSDLLGLIDWTLILGALILFTLLALLLSWYVRLLSNAYNQTLLLANEKIEIDGLTGLYSRYKIQKELDELIKTCELNANKLVVFFLDLDHFKTINDAFGHETGDKLLVKVAQRLKSVLPDKAIIGRLGGDEFLVLMVLDDKKACVFLERLCREVILQISQSYFVEGGTLNIGCSIGAALYPDYGQDAETLIKNADMAMYEAKSAGRATYYFYDGAMGARISRNMRIETRLRYALQNSLLELHFQPKVDLNTKECVGMEALLRWEDSELGTVSPMEFIPIAEQSGIILMLGEWVFEQTFKHLVIWKEQGVQVPPIAINCSAAQLKRPNFLSHLLSLLDKYQIDPSLLEIEVTESILIEDAKGCAELLRQVSKLGIKLAIDDFGTGYSSLSYLKDLPFHYVKIDQVFIRDFMEDSDHDALTRAIINLSHDLNLKVIAEGITRVDQMERLREYGCDIGQGYLFSKALGANSMASDPMIVALNEKQGDSFDG